MSPTDAPRAAQTCKHCQRPIALTPAGYGHSVLFPRLVEGDRHRALPARVDFGSPPPGVDPGISV
jgi:hypothetical protein